ncbi:hypothetical protein, partial [Burkholderia stabilis]
RAGRVSPSSLFRDLRVIFSRYWRSRRGSTRYGARLRFSYNTCPLEYGNKQARFLLNQFSGHRNRAGSPIRHPAAADAICRAAYRFAARANPRQVCPGI